MDSSLPLNTKRLGVFAMYWQGQSLPWNPVRLVWNEGQGSIYLTP